MKPTDAAYLAGLLDGEGCLSARGRTFKRPSVEILMTTPAPLFWAAQVSGVGSVYKASEVRGNRRVPWRWVTTKAEDVLALCQAVKPWAILKLPQIQALSVLCLLRRAKARKFGSREFAEGEGKIDQILSLLKREDYNEAYQEALDLAVYLRQAIEERKCRS